MGNCLAPDLFRSIRARVRIRDVLAEAGVHVSRSGTYCDPPPHADHDAAAQIYDEGTARERAHCHACGWHGDVVDFYGRLHGLNPAGAARELARRAGLDGGPGDLPRPVVSLDDALDRAMCGVAARAAPHIAGEVYAALLRALGLDEVHRARLRDRSLTDKRIVWASFRTLTPPGPPWRREEVVERLVAEFGGETLLAVPGFYRRNGRLVLCGYSGLVVPVRRLTGELAGLKIRTDNGTAYPDGTPAPRYSWLSSARHGGPGPAAMLRPEDIGDLADPDRPRLPCHVPLPGPDPWAEGQIRLVEGPLAADVVSALDPEHVLTIGMDSCSGWRNALPVLRELRPAVVRLAIDQDWRFKPAVARALRDAIDGLTRHGYEVRIDEWPNSFKGLDDYLGALARAQGGRDA